MMDWLVNHTDDIIKFVPYVYIIIDVIVRATPTPKDDKVLLETKNIVLKLWYGLEKAMTASKKK